MESSDVEGSEGSENELEYKEEEYFSDVEKEPQDEPQELKEFRTLWKKEIDDTVKITTISKTETKFKSPNDGNLIISIVIVPHIEKFIFSLIEKCYYCKLYNGYYKKPCFHISAEDWARISRFATICKSVKMAVEEWIISKKNVLEFIIAFEVEDTIYNYFRGKKHTENIHITSVSIEVGGSVTMPKYNVHWPHQIICLCGSIGWKTIVRKKMLDGFQTNGKTLENKILNQKDIEKFKLMMERKSYDYIRDCIQKKSTFDHFF